MVLHERQLALQIDDRGAVYPVTIDPTLVQQAYLKASNPDVDDNFGIALAVSGDTVVVGAPSEDSVARGVNGDQADNTLLSSGAAYVFVREGSAWRQQAYLKASHPGELDGFGTAVAISRDTVVIGAPNESSAAIGVNGDASDDSLFRSGAAYVFVREAGVWRQQAYLKASNPGGSYLFGSSVAVWGDTVAVGSPLEASSATGVDGRQDDASASNSGAAYVFERAGGSWSQQAYLKASNTDAGDYFGTAIALAGDTLAVGARYEASAASGVNGDQSDNSLLDSGAAYVFVRRAGSWTQHAYLKASNPGEGDEFGSAVAVSGESIVVGAFREDSSATGVNGEGIDNSAPDSGAAYVFVRDGESWRQQVYLKASNTEAGDWFGASVAISGDSLVVGAPREDGGSRGVGGDENDNSNSGSGAVYGFVRIGGLWGQQAYIKASNADPQDGFGTSLGISGGVGAAGAFWESSGASGVDGEQSDNGTARSGAAYVFYVPGTYTIGGTTEGLEGAGLVLQKNGGDDLLVGVNGRFSFATPLFDLTPYSVTVAAQPTGPSQTCTIANGSGTVDGANVTDVVVSCAIDRFDIGGTVSGLTGSGLVLRNNGVDDLVINAEGPFSFSTPVVDGGSYAVTVHAQPGAPAQSCTVSNGNGTVSGAAVSQVSITCSYVNARAHTDLLLQRLDPGSADLREDVAQGSTLLRYALQISNRGPQPLAAASVRLTAQGALSEVLWSCTPPAACTPINGSGDVRTQVRLAVGQSVSIEVSGRLVPGARFIELVAELTGTGLADARSERVGSLRRVLSELAAPEALFRSGYE
nr:FG-GAP repeat protein [Lysobacter sp. CAU 1642]